MYFVNEVYVCLCVHMDVYIHMHMHINDLHETNVQTIFFSLLFCYQSVIFDLIAVGGRA